MQKFRVFARVDICKQIFCILVLVILNNEILHKYTFGKAHCDYLLKWSTTQFNLRLGAEARGGALAGEEVGGDVGEIRIGGSHREAVALSRQNR
jgi:hypothetical protein